MSRFLSYGVFVPSSHDEKVREAPPSAVAQPILKWVKVGSRWVKVESDGEPVDDPKSLASEDDTLPHNFDKSSNNIPGVDGVNYTDVDGGGSKGSRDGRILSRRGSSFANTTAGSWETPPPTSDSCEDEGTPSSSGSTHPGNHVKWSSSHTPDKADVERHSGEGSTGEEQERYLGVKSEANVNGENKIPKQYSDQLEHDANGEPESHSEAESSEKRLRQENNLTKHGPSTHDVAVEVTRGVQQHVSDDVKCVGERAPVRSGAKGWDGGGNSNKRKGRCKRSSSGSSNRTNSPRKGKTNKPAVETRDVACQWDGSEMGDDEDDVYPQVELPDTPDCRGLTAVLRLYDHARLENKRMGVRSSRPGWGVEDNIEKWEGVYVDMEERVVALDVDGDPDNRQAVLIGPLPVELAEMDRLEQLTLRRHRFKGRIPGELGKLTRLTHLNLTNCRLIGFIPREFGDLASLVVLNLSWNFLSGGLPTELGKLSHLQELLLNSNSFSGSLPSELGKMKQLRRFNAGHNIAISGVLPPELYRLTKLTILDLRHNKISGRIPPLYGRLTNLEQLWLQDNEIADEIPAELARLPNLEMMALTNNKISGVIPLALRGHPRYRSFKILSGNVALGERVAPKPKEVEAAIRRMPSTDAMSHASAAHAQAQAMQRAQQQQEALRRASGSGSMSFSPSVEGAYNSISGRRQTVSGSGVSSSQSSVVDGEEGKRHNSGRSSMGRRLRSMRRIMGKKQTPPTSPGLSLSDVRERSLSPVGRILTPGTGTTFSSPASEVTAESAQALRRTMNTGGKALMEETEDDIREVNDNNNDDDNDSLNVTESISTGNGTSRYASPSRIERRQRG